MYYYTIEQKEKINARIAVPLGILPLLVTALFYYVDKISSLKEGLSFVFFIVLLIIYALSIICTVILTFKAYYGYEYQYLPTPTGLYEQSERITKYYDDNYEKYFKSVGATKNDLIEEDFKNNLLYIYKKATDTNIKSNDKKTKYLRYISWTLSVAIASGFFGTIPFYLSKDKDESQKIEITNLKELKNHINNLELKGRIYMPDNERSSNQEPSASTPPPKPENVEPRSVTETFENKPKYESNDSE